MDIPYQFCSRCAIGVSKSFRINYILDLLDFALAFGYPSVPTGSRF